MKKVLKIAALVIGGILILTGCKGANFDAEKALDSVLKVYLHGEFEDYAKISGTEVEDVEKMYDQEIDMMMSSLEELSALGVNVTDEYGEKMKELLALGKYEIKGSEKDKDDNYVVTVDVLPSNVMSLFFDNVIQNAISASEADTDVGDAVLKGLDTAIQEQSNGEAETYEVTFTKGEDGVYDVDQEDMNEMIDAFFPMPESLMQPSGKVYEEETFNWTKKEWDAASEDDKNKCCLAIVREVNGFTEEQMQYVDLSDPTIQDSLQMIKDGIDMSFSGGLNVSIGDYVTLIMGAALS